MTRIKHSHCSYCGTPYSAADWPRNCSSCEIVSYVNPLPVVVALVPVDDGLLCIRRTIEPRKGEIALPGGFLEVGESWEEGCVRELREETGVVIGADEVTLFRVFTAARIGASGKEGVLLVFGLTAPRRAADLPEFAANDETSETVVVRGPAELAFPLHTRAANEYFARRGV